MKSFLQRNCIAEMCRSLSDREKYSGMRGGSQVGSGIYQRHWPLRMLDGDCELPNKAESMVSPLVGHRHSYLPVGFKFMPGIYIFYLI